jgi:predicted HTH transcriptional regulator
MRPKKLLELVAEGESSIMEFKRKSTTPFKLAKEISALANTKGGMLIIGVDDDGTIYGIESEKTEIEAVERACGFHIDPPIEPDMEVVNVKGKDVLFVIINEGEHKPHKLMIEDPETKQIHHRAYIRIGEQSVEASREMYRLMKNSTAGKPLKLSIGENERRLFEYLEKKERITVKDFSHLVNISERRAERMMIKLVQAGVLHIHNDSTRDYFTLV